VKKNGITGSSGVGEGVVKKGGDSAKKGDKIDMQQLEEQVLRVVAAAQHEQVVEAVSRLLASNGSKMCKTEFASLLDLQRVAILVCIRAGASHGFGLVRVCVYFYFCVCVCIHK